MNVLLSLSHRSFLLRLLDIPVTLPPPFRLSLFLAFFLASFSFPFLLSSRLPCVGFSYKFAILIVFALVIDFPLMFQLLIFYLVPDGQLMIIYSFDWFPVRARIVLGLSG